ncbi:MAG TPA: glycosyltransferase family 2 protein [Bacteroidales bacterium]|nr:glycosyltransferase family 2 protein [Bacteroidales bacterium]
MSNTQPTVSVIMPCYNSAGTIAQSISSVLDQTFGSIELIVLDDGSTDNTVQIARRFAAEDTRLRLVCSARNRGVTRMRNIGTRLAKGKWIAFCDSDDTWLPQKLEWQLQLAGERKGVNLLYSAVYYTRERNPEARQLVKLIPDATYNDMLKTNAIPMSSSMYLTESLGKLFFRPVPSHLVHEDYAFWLDVFKSGRVLSAYCEKPTTIILLRKGSRSSNALLAARSHLAILMNEKNLPWHKILRYMIIYMTIATRKRLPF